MDFDDSSVVNIFSEAAAQFELVASQVEKDCTVNNITPSELQDKLEGLWIKLQTLTDGESSSKVRRTALENAQQTLMKLYDNKQKSKQNLAKTDQDGERTASIEETILKCDDVTFNDIAGLEDAKVLLKEAIVLPLQYPHLFVGNRKPWRSILLYGPPGTGKSRIAQAVSSEINSTFYSVSSSDLLSSWFGESEKLIKELFEHARSQQGGRAIIFIDEIDSLCRKRDSKEAETTRRVKTELLKQIQGANKSKQNDVFFLCATNCPWELDTAFLRRFEKRIFIKLPDREARRSLFNIHLGDVEYSFSENDWDRLLDMTSGYSGSDLATCIRDALLEPVRQLQSAKYWKWSEDKSSLRPSQEGEEGAVCLRLQNIPREKVQPRALKFEDILKSLSSNHRTISNKDLHRYEEFTGSFGQNG